MKSHGSKTEQFSLTHKLTFANTVDLSVSRGTITAEAALCIHTLRQPGTAMSAQQALVHIHAALQALGEFEAAWTTVDAFVGPTLVHAELVVRTVVAAVPALVNICGKAARVRNWPPLHPV